MDSWIDYYNSGPSIYVSAAHKKAHFEVIAADIRRYIPSREAVVVDYSCGEALSAADVAADCRELLLAEPAESVRNHLSRRFSGQQGIKVVSLDDLRTLPVASVDLVVMISVAQYMTIEALDEAFVLIRRLLKPEGRFVLGDILDPKVGAITDVMALLRFAASHGFLTAATIGVLRMALSDYRAIRQKVGLQTYSETEMLAKLAASGFNASRDPRNVGYNPARMTFLASPARQQTGD